ncbi:hypothetical protein ABB37_02811 [Leptomonas pyrrhocoris]|uniref:Histone-binding protein RBBP4-like N-terminal domain-containing protein n=1 Tax=Leptomonas pyrrhocoris TaxID=157538 RepID=A0A0N0DXL1_LEPPY|nr:hypothetical protein ABB37_02811 [Leptomonas pyrrhocoris]KPA83105.1 hypothetical protein ABB37_02811 [Leptomonas pyrrhocoris]|eukprot:XP_015661544.1 hypothetical protein ABB37_02811 [Leptomonas pyrrhocoris]
MSTDDSISGGEERAFLEAVPPPAHNDPFDASARPAVPPAATRVTRSQALARLRRGETINDEAAAVPTPTAAPRSGSSSFDKAHDSAMDGLIDTSAKKSSDDTSSHAAAAGGVGRNTAAAAGTVNGNAGAPGVASRGREEGRMRKLGDGDAAPFGDSNVGTRRHRHQDGSDGEGDEDADDEHGGVFGNTEGAEEGEAESENRRGSAATTRPSSGLTGVAPSAARDSTRPRRTRDGQRLAAAALPRMLALQRAFETEAPHLYEFCCTQVVEWPALAIEWIPDRAFSDPERDYTLQYIAVGTQVHPSSGTPNTVKVMEVAVPVPTMKDVMYGLYGDDDIHGAEADDPELQEFVDPGKRFVNVKGHFHCEQTLTMDAPVLKIRAMPAETNILAVKTASGFVGVYNTVQELQEDAAGRTVPDALLRGHSRGGFGLSWNTLKPGYIASASDDGYVNYYDISHRLTIDLQQNTAMDPELTGPETQPIERLVGHRDIVTDCSWHSSQSHLLASSSMDGDVRIWDIRMSAGSSTIHSAHPNGATAAQFHPVGAFQLATAGAEGSVHLWDIRRTADPVAALNYHGRSVMGLQWSPSKETVLASYGDDGRVVLWDLAKTSLPLAYSEDGVAPPEVAFVHMGHVGRVTDASWNSVKTEDWLLASADTTNGLHVYRPSQKVMQDYRMFE